MLSSTACRDLKQISSNIPKEASQWMVCQWFDHIQLKETRENSNVPAVWRWIASPGITWYPNKSPQQSFFSTDYVPQMIPEEILVLKDQTDQTPTFPLLCHALCNVHHVSGWPFLWCMPSSISVFPRTPMQQSRSWSWLGVLGDDPRWMMRYGVMEVS